MRDSSRPDPDALLAVTDGRAKGSRGRLKIFLGASPGVGKTYTMLEAAQAAFAAGRDVVIGIVETHGRSETRRLVEGLPALPRRSIEYRGRTFEEFDLDAAVARAPSVCLVDELAHSNVPGSRHEKRWQDIEEIRDAGIDVWTTLNIQHLASLNDVVAGITGVVVRETVPDAVLDEADALELVDVSTDVLRDRLRAGQIYVPHMVGPALDRFFRPGNLAALRELALRRAAERVDADVLDHRRATGTSAPWRTSERVLAVLHPGRDNDRMVRQAQRIASRLRAEWLVVYVETPARQDQRNERAAVESALSLAESLGAEAITIPGLRERDDVLAFAAQRNVTTLLMPAPTGPWWQSLAERWSLDRLVASASGIDVLVVGAADVSARPVEDTAPLAPAVARDWVTAIGSIAVVTGLGVLFRAWLTTTDLAMLYLLATAGAAARAKRGPAIAAAVLAILSFDFFFVPPYLTFSVSDARYILTFAVMLGTSLVVVSLTGRLRVQTWAARDRERRTGALYALSRQLATARTLDDVAAAVIAEIRSTFSAKVSFLLVESGGALRVLGGEGPSDEKEMAVARWAAEHADAAGLGTQTLPGARAQYIPLVAGDTVLGVLGVEPDSPAQVASADRRSLLDAFRQLAALAVERVTLAEAGRARAVEIEAERLRSTLLSSLSHDLRTPLAGIEGTASTLVRDAASLTVETRRDLSENIVTEARRLSRLITNLLEMVRVDSGALALHKEWMPLEEIVGVVLIRYADLLAQHPVESELPADLPLAPMDPVLIEQVLSNLLENAARHTEPGTRIVIRAWSQDDALCVAVEDNGRGLSPGEEESVFERFRRGDVAAPGSGIGLGLAICRGIVSAHGGRIWAERRPEGGARFVFALPLEGGLPADALVTAERAEVS